ncbi:uncharacterized protein LOC6525405 [Drosophila yakuba]|uniref:Uncharacterized protein n=1 Tax=Drosophila yakuba TaxID=7245 RepID=B4Q0S7_DROYA|nr:uncharacterized protein LOC6525405 [Drosophila yakuba]EDX02348.1 uncharacterized protein Dyak_GE15734 [Drosophila yakuba]
MLKHSLILILILVVAVCCFAAELPGNAYLPPLRHYHQLPDDIPPAVNGFPVDMDRDSFERYAPIFLDYPEVRPLLREQQEYALDLPFEEKHHYRKTSGLENAAAANRNW